jgi:amino acid transporter
MEKIEATVKNIQAPPPGKLGKPELYAISIGTVIGAGIVTLIGPAITLTGYSAWLSYLLAIVLGLFLIFPMVFVSSSLRLGGGYYSLLGALAGPKFAGMYAFASLTQLLGLSLYGLSLGLYAHSIWPVLNAQVVGFIFLTAFYIINLFGINIMAAAQKLMTWFLIAALLMFIVFGMMHLKNPVFEFHNPSFMSNGLNGLIAGLFLFVYSTQGYVLTMQYGRDAKNAKRDIPWAMLMTVPTLVILYCGVAVVGAGVLPLAQVAGQPLTFAAKSILPPLLFVVFMVGGPILSLGTTINAAMGGLCYPISQSCRDGWLPKSFAAQNKYGSHWKILTFMYLLAVIPLLLSFNVSIITNNIMLLNSTLSLLYIYAYIRFPAKYPEAWKKSRLHIPNGLYYMICALSSVGLLAVIYMASKSLTPTIVIVSTSVIAICMVLGLVRSKDPNVHINTTVWDED